MTVGEAAVADVAVACSEEEFIWALQGGNHRLAFEQPGGRLIKAWHGIGSQSMEPQHKRRLGIYSIGFEQKVVAVQPLGKNVRS